MQININFIILEEGENNNESFQSSPIELGMQWHLPKFDEAGYEYITGATHFRAIQMEGWSK